jgi:hypothetical protein
MAALAAVGDVPPLRCAVHSRRYSFVLALSYLWNCSALRIVCERGTREGGGEGRRGEEQERGEERGGEGG